MKLLRRLVAENDGMELVQVAILVAIAIVIGLIFRTQIQSFVEGIFDSLSSGSFQ
jgi:Flp pilus assembly pilin Flp